MYKIIGGDGREYGPVAAEQVRAWLREGRATLQTLAQPVGSTDWRPLGTLPEFATPPSVVPPFAAPTAVPGSDKKLPAGILGILLGGLGIHKFFLGYASEGVLMLVVTLVGGIVTCGVAATVMHIIGIIEGVIYLSKSDAEFVQTYVRQRKGWF